MKPDGSSEFGCGNMRAIAPFMMSLVHVMALICGRISFGNARRVKSSLPMENVRWAIRIALP